VNIFSFFHSSDSWQLSIFRDPNLPCKTFITKVFPMRCGVGWNDRSSVPHETKYPYENNNVSMDGSYEGKKNTKGPTWVVGSQER